MSGKRPAMVFQIKLTAENRETVADFPKPREELIDPAPGCAGDACQIMKPAD
ncbi:MAG: hypothetical protein ACOYM3_25165 [Terrimicrobiaceae bacterium]